MSKFYIRRMALASRSQLDITFEQYLDLQHAAMIQLEAYYLEQKYEFVIQNYIEFENDLLRAGVHDLLLNETDIGWFHSTRSLFDRRVMNLLTTFRTYDDSRPQHFNKIFGTESGMAEQAKSKFSHEYDARLAYRAVCKLRNYIQHDGFPVHGSNYSGEWLTTDEGARASRRHTVNPYLNTAQLRKGSYTRGVLEELEAKGGKIDLKWLMREFIEGFSAAHVANRELLKNILEWAGNYISSAVDAYFEVSPEEKRSPVGLFAMEKGSESSDATVYLHQGAEEQRSFLVKKNGSLINLSRAYISGEVLKLK